MKHKLQSYTSSEVTSDIILFITGNWNVIDIPDKRGKNLEKPEDIHAVGFRKMQTKYFSNFCR